MNKFSTRQIPAPATHYGQIKTAFADLWRRPIQNIAGLTPRARRRNRQSQVLRSDPPFEIVRELDNFYLIQLADLTLGWIPSKAVKTIKAKEPWAKIRRPENGKTLAIKWPPETKIRKTLEKYSSLPYLWGGCGGDGLDCSAFTQRALLEWTGYLLPRNSYIQKKCGKTVRQKDLRPLDLIFLRHRKSDRSHVGVYFDKLVWHFCLDCNGLTNEPLDEILKRYSFSTIRRLFVPC